MRFSINREKLRLVGRLSLLSTIFRAARLRQLRFIIYRGAIVRAARRSISGDGRISIGKRWYGEGVVPSSFVVMASGHVESEGAFTFHRGCDVRVLGDARLALGSGYCADGVHIRCEDNIRIGHGVAIARDVAIMDSDQHSIAGASTKAPVVIGDHVWIGARAIILKGVTIGSGAVIAAGAVVSRDIPPGMLAAGIPARPIRPIEWS